MASVVKKSPRKKVSKEHWKKKQQDKKLGQKGKKPVEIEDSEEETEILEMEP